MSSVARRRRARKYSRPWRASTRKHFVEMIVTAQACDFRQDPKKDRTSRVAVCENPILSLRNVGQRFPVLALDMDKLPVLTRDEFRNIITGLAVFYDITDAETTGPAEKRQKKMFSAEIELARATLAMQKASITDVKDSETFAIQDAAEK